VDSSLGETLAVISSHYHIPPSFLIKYYDRPDGFIDVALDLMLVSRFYDKFKFTLPRGMSGTGTSVYERVKKRIRSINLKEAY